MLLLIQVHVCDIFVADYMIASRERDDIPENVLSEKRSSKLLFPTPVNKK